MQDRTAPSTADSTAALLGRLNLAMIGFDLVLATAAIAAPRGVLWLLGHDDPSDDAVALLQRCAPIWYTFAAGHTVAAVRGTQGDWQAVAWLRATEIGTDIVWSRVGPFGLRGKVLLTGAGVANVAMAAGFGWLGRRRRSEQH